MGLFEFLMILVSVVIGLGLTEILTGAANLLYPSSPEGADLEEYYYRQASLLWGLVIAGTVLGTFLQPLIFGDPVFHIRLISQGFR